MDKNEKIKVTHVTRYAYPHVGGIEAVISQICNALPDNKFEKEILCCSNIEKSCKENGILYNRCKFLFEFASNTISLEFIYKLSKVDTDILHYHMPFIFAVIAHFIARPKYKKLYITYHSDIVGYDKIMTLFWGLYKKFLNKVDKIHVLSPNIIESSNILNSYKNKCVVIPQGIPLETTLNNKKTEEIKQRYENKKIIFSLGRLVTYKGFIYALEAMQHIENAVYLLGGSGPLQEDFNDYIEKYNLQDKVFLLGKIPDSELNAYYNCCDIYLFPSIMQSEAFGIVQLEAMRFGKPVINTNLGTGVNYVSVNNETGLTVNPGNAKELADAINKLLNNDELRLKLGKNAQLRVEQKFNIDYITKEYINLYSAS